MTEAASDSTGLYATPRRSAQRLSRRACFIAGITLFLLALALRLAFIDRHGMWADEVFSLAMATGHSLEHPAGIADASSGDFVELPGAVSPVFYADYLEHREPVANPARVVRAVFLSDTSPPGYYILLYLWTLALGTSELSARVFSLLWALAAFPVICSIARTLGGRWSAVMAGLAYAISPLCIHYSVEMRMYSMLWFWSACLIWLTLRLHRQHEGRAAALAAWIAVGTAGFLTHYFFAFPWLAACLWLLFHPGPQGRTWLILAGMAVGFLVAPWYIRVPDSLDNWRVTGDWLSDPPASFNWLRDTALLALQFLSPRGPWGLRPQWDLVAAAMVLGLAALSWGRVRWRGRRRQLLWLTLAAACLGPLMIDLARGTYMVAVPRYAIAALPAVFVVLGIALGRVRPWSRPVFVLVLLGFSLVGMRRIWLNEGRSFEPMREIAALVAPELTPGELVIIHSIPSGVIGMARYLEEYRPADGPQPVLAAWVGQLDRRRMPDDLFELIEGRQRVTVILVHDVGAPDPELDWLFENAHLVGEREIEGIGAYSFAPRDAERFAPPR